MLHNKQDLAIQELKEQIGELMQKIDAKELPSAKLADMDEKVDKIGKKLGLIGHQLDDKDELIKLMDEKIQAQGQLIVDLGHKLDAQTQVTLDLGDKLNAQTQVTLDIGDKIDDIQLETTTLAEMKAVVLQLCDQTDAMHRWNDREAGMMNAKIDVLIGLVTRLDLVQIPVSERPPGFV